MDLYPANATDVQDPLLALLEDYNKGDRSVRCRRRKAGRSRAKPGATGRLSSCSIRARRRRLRCRGEVSHPRERCGATDRPSPAGADRQRRQYEGLYDPQRRRVYPVESACRQGAEAARRPVRVDSRRRLYQPPAQRLFGVCPLHQGATSTAAKYLAQTQNASDLIGGVSKSGDRYVDHTMFDMVQSLTIADSLKFGKAVLEKMGNINNLHKNRVEQAGFAVLKAPDIPPFWWRRRLSVTWKKSGN